MGLDVYLQEWNEYHALLAICLGTLAHGSTVLRSRQHLLQFVALAAICLLPAWFLSEPPNRAFELPVAWALCFGVSYAVVFRKAILPLVTAAGVLHYLLLTYYALHLSARAAGAHLPTSILVVGLAPGVLLALGSLFGLLSKAWFRVGAYVGYLGCMPLLVLLQDPAEKLKTTYIETGFSWELYLVAFFLGGVALAVCSHLVQLILLLPPLERSSTRRVLDAVLGPVEVHQEQARLFAARHLGGRVDAIALGLLLAHGALLVLNARSGWISHALLIQGSIVVLAWVLMPWEAARRLRPAATAGAENP